MYYKISKIQSKETTLKYVRENIDLPIKAKPDFVTDPIDNPKSLEIMERGIIRNDSK